MSLLRRAKTRVRAAAETQILRQRQHFHAAEMSRASELGAAVGRPVVDDHDLVFRIARQRGFNRGQILFQQVAAVPVGDHDAWRRRA